MLIFFVLTTDFWPEILVTTDFCDLEFNLTIKPKIQSIRMFVKIALSKILMMSDF